MRKKRRKAPLNTRHSSSNKKIDRLAFLLFTVAFSCVMVLGSTYAWFTSADSVTNKFDGTVLRAEINENFKPNYEWSPGKKTIKEVWVTNTGDTEAFVRVSFDEFLVSFKMEIEGLNNQEGTGNVLGIRPKPAKGTIQRNEPSTWKKGDYYHKISIDDYYQAVTTVPADLGTTGKGYRYGVDNDLRKNSDLKYTTLEFGDVETQHVAAKNNYWLYGKDGFYYYSERLAPGESTSLLLKSTTLSKSVPNRLKDSLYQIDIKMDAQQSVSETFKDWNHSAVTDQVYLMLKDKVSN